MSQTPDSQRGCVVIPALNEERRIADVVRRVRERIPEVIVIDDGSRDDTSGVAGAAGATVLKHGVNRGKGAALETGFRYVRERGFDFVVTMDGDGQHDPADLTRFVETHTRTGIPVLVGNRMTDVDRMPVVRRLTNRFMSWLLSREMGQSVPDTQCGYRLFQSDVIPILSAESAGFAAESEVLLELAGRDIRIGSVPVATIYRDEKSKISPFKDALRFFGMLRRYRRSKRLRKTL
jgi:glycosyltransferase involved in cell wall biosynthesis